MTIIKNRLKLKDVNYLYLIIMALFVLGGEVLQKLDLPPLSYGIKMLFVFLTQLVFVGLPAIIFILIKKPSFKDLRFNKISFENICLSIGIIIFSMPVVLFINFFWILFLQYFGKLHTPINFASENIYQLAINLMIVAVTPAIFEEILFRGIILKGYERIGKVSAIVCTSILFGLLHRDIQSLVGTILLGIIISYVVYKTNSIYPGMIAHFINNGFAVVFSYYVSKYLPQSLEQMGPDSTVNIFSQTQQLLIAGTFLGVVATIFLAVLVGLFIIFRHTTKEIYKDEEVNTDRNVSIGEFIPIIASLALVIVVFVKQLTA